MRRRGVPTLTTPAAALIAGLGAPGVIRRCAEPVTLASFLSAGRAPQLDLLQGGEILAREGLLPAACRLHAGVGEEIRHDLCVLIGLE